MNNWASGNEGFAISMPDAGPYDFPTTPTEGFDGKGVKLTTKSTGELGAGMNMPIAAGNLFIGKFNGTAALMDAMSATQFGLPSIESLLNFRVITNTLQEPNIRIKAKSLLIRRTKQAYMLYSIKITISKAT